MNAAYRYDFRRMNWGMTQDEILASESAEPTHVMPAVILYDEVIYGYPMTLGYNFALKERGVVCVAAVLQNDQKTNLAYVKMPHKPGAISRAAKAVEDYDSWKASLKQEHGEPMAEDVAYRDEESIESLKSKEYMKMGADDQVPDFLPPEWLDAEHSEAEMLSLMRYTLGQSARTNTTLCLSPGPLGGAFLLIRHDSREHAH